MILAAGLSPALQQTMAFDALEPGEVNRAAEVHWCASGKVLNVGMALARLGCRQRTLSVLGGNTGAAIERSFAAEQVDARWVWTDRPTRVCTTVIERSAGRITELVENARAIPATALDAFRRAYNEEAAAAEIVVLTGSLPEGVPGSLFRELLGQTPGRAILDIRGEDLIAALALKPLIVKPNRAELAATVGHALTTDEDLIHAMRELNRRGAVWVLISQGGGPVWLSSANELYRIDVPSLTVVNTIGSGDCLAAGLAWGLSQGFEVPEAACLGIAAAMENVGDILPARLDPQWVRDQASRLTPQRINTEEYVRGAIL